MILARDMMSPNVVQLERDASAHAAAELMAKRRVGSIIITATGFPVGILTETDIVRLVAERKNLHEIRVSDLMSSPLFSTTPEGDLLAVASTMSANRIKKMPVIERQRVVGMITQTDVVRFALHAIQELQTNYSEGKLSEVEFSRQAAELFSSVPRLSDATKHWHMRCTSCGHRFLADEANDGTLSVKTCPQCGGAIAYDLAPPL